MHHYNFTLPYVAEQAALEEGRTVDDVHNLTRIDRFFLSKLRNIAMMKKVPVLPPST